MYCVGIRYVLNCNTCKYRLNTYYNTYHNTCQIHRTRIGMYCNTCQCKPACIGMYYVGIWYVWNDDTCQYWPNTCLFFNTCQYWRQYIHQYEPNTIEYRPIQSQIQTNTSTADQCTHHRFQYLLFNMPVQASVLSKQAPPPAPQHRCVRGIWAFQAVHGSTPLGRRHTVPRCCETAELSTPPQISRAPIRRNVASSPSAWSPESLSMPIF